MLAGVRRHLEEAREALVSSVEAAGRGDVDPAYRLALKSRNALFHAQRGVAAARGETLPEMPVSGSPGGGIDDHLAALGALDAALGATDDTQEMPRWFDAARIPYARYLGWLREQVGKILQPPR